MTDEFGDERKRRVIVYVLATRYGPRTSCQRKGLSLLLYLILREVEAVTERDVAG